MSDEILSDVVGATPDAPIPMSGNPAAGGELVGGDGDASGYWDPETDPEVPYGGSPDWTPAEGEEYGWADEDAPPEAVPYERYHAVNEQLEALAGWMPVIEALQREGYSDAQAVEAALQEQWRQDAEAQEAAWQQEQALQLQALVDSGAMDPAVAEQQLALTLQQRQLEQDRAMYQEMRVQMEIQAAAEQFPNMDPNYVLAMHYATGQPIGELAQITNDWIRQLEERALARYLAEKEWDAAMAAPEGAGGDPVFQPTPSRDAWRLPYSRLFGIGRTE